MSATWSWVLAGTFLLTLVAVTARPNKAWVPVTLHQVLWVLYIFQTAQWGFLVVVVIYTLAYAAALYNARKNGTDFRPSPPFN